MTLRHHTRREGTTLFQLGNFILPHEADDVLDGFHGLGGDGMSVHQRN
jgi:hypothetical protein